MYKVLLLLVLICMGGTACVSNYRHPSELRFLGNEGWLLDIA